MTDTPKEKYYKTEDGKFKIVREMETDLDANQLVTLREQQVRLVEKSEQNVKEKEKEIEIHKKNLQHIEQLIDTAKGLGIDFTEAEKTLEEFKTKESKGKK